MTFHFCLQEEQFVYLVTWFLAILSGYIALYTKIEKVKIIPKILLFLSITFISFAFFTILYCQKDYYRFLPVIFICTLTLLLLMLFWYVGKHDGQKAHHLTQFELEQMTHIMSQYKNWSDKI
jgi:hypothetical protein